jgi:hypothetical protein
MSAVADTATKRIEAAGLSFSVPNAWEEEQPKSSMRKAQLQIPAVSPDTEAASLVLYYFGQNQGGSVEANLKRWEGQFDVPADAADAKNVATKTVAGMNVTTLELTGTYVAPLSPRTPNQRHNKPNFRLFAAVVETAQGNFFIKIVGPAGTMTQSSQHFEHMIDSLTWQN